MNYVTSTRQENASRAFAGIRRAFLPLVTQSPGACTIMGPRTSISGELPIHSYFSSSSKTAGTSGNTEDRSLKRRTEADPTDDVKLSTTKKQRTKRPSEGADLGSQDKIRSGMSYWTLGL